MTYQFLQVEMRDRVARIALNRPEVMNAMHPPAWGELTAAFAGVSNHDGVWAVILTGSGNRAFCAGADLKFKAQQQAAAAGRPVDRFLSVAANCWKPVIAAVNGYALGGGFELALQCDIILAAAHAQFGFPEVKRGLLADAGGCVCLPRRIPYHAAMSLLLTGRMMGAEEARALGLVAAVYPEDRLGEESWRWAMEMAANSPLAVQATKQAVKASRDLPAETAIRGIEALEAVRRLRGSEDYVEGPRAFAEKRPPQWKAQ